MRRFPPVHLVWACDTCFAGCCRTTAPAHPRRPATGKAATAAPRPGARTTQAPLAVCRQLNQACFPELPRNSMHQVILETGAKLFGLQHPWHRRVSSCSTCALPRHIHAPVACCSRQQRVPGRHAARGGARCERAAGAGHDGGGAARHPAAAVPPHAPRRGAPRRPSMSQSFDICSLSIKAHSLR